MGEVDSTCVCLPDLCRNEATAAGIVCWECVWADPAVQCPAASGDVVGEVDLDAAIRAKLASALTAEAEVYASTLRAVMDLHSHDDAMWARISGWPLRECRTCGVISPEGDKPTPCETVRVVARELGVTQ